MRKIEQWPPPDWTEVRISWDAVMQPDHPGPNAITAWLETAPGGDYHLHGYGIDLTGTLSPASDRDEGFAYRFKNHQDAVYFALKWT